MKPLNLDNSPCSPVSSNCVIWQGPDIPCIKLCKGDTVSDVLYKLATELCTIMDTLNISNYDLSCFNLVGCPPGDFEALINFLIQRICELQNVTPPTTVETGECPDNCRVSVLECFGGGTDTLPNYVNTIATRLCELVDEITIINGSINSLQVQIDDLAADIAAIVIPPSPAPVAITCPIGTLVPPNAYAVDVLLDEFINQVWCSFVGVTGGTSDLLNAVSSQCVTTTSTTMASRITNPAATMGAVYGPAFTNGTTVAETIENLWIAICDLRDIELMGYQVTTTNDVTVITNVVGTTTTFTIGRTPKINYYAEAITPTNIVADPSFIDGQYFQPVGYTILSYTNTSGSAKDFIVHVSYDTNLQNISANSPSVANWLDGALIKNGNIFSPLYSSAGLFNLSGSLFDGPNPGDDINIGTLEQVLTTPSNNPVEFRFLNTNLPRNVSFFKKVNLLNGESIQLMFKSKLGNVGYLLQAQFYVEEIR